MITFQEIGILHYLKELESTNKFEFMSNPPQGLFINQTEAKMNIESLIGLKMVEYVGTGEHTIRITDYGRHIYQMKDEENKAAIKKEKLEIKQIKSNIKASKSVISTNRNSNINIMSTLVFGFIVTVLSIRSCYRESKKDTEQAQRDSILQEQQLKQLQSDSILNEKLEMIFHALSDTSTNKVKIEK